MSFGDRFGMAGVILALFALASQYLWPDKKWIGWLSLSCAVALLVSWGWLEFGSELPRLRSRYSVISAVVVFIVGGCLALGAWRLVTPPLSSKPSIHPAPRRGENQRGGASAESADPTRPLCKTVPPAS